MSHFNPFLGVDCEVGDLGIGFKCLECKSTVEEENQYRTDNGMAADFTEGDTRYITYYVDKYNACTKLCAQEDGTYVSDTGTHCLECGVENCVKCDSVGLDPVTECDKCTPERYLMPDQDQCVFPASCTPRMFTVFNLVTGNKCHSCVDPCDECNHFSICKTCMAGKYVYKTRAEIESGVYSSGGTYSVECLDCVPTDHQLIVDDQFCTDC
jgi:hypothetical protein